LKYDTGEDRRKSVGPIILKIWKYHEESRRKVTSYLQQSEGRLTIGYILRNNCFIKHDTEGKLEGRDRRGRRSKQLLDDLKETM
jgi:hypothetical protein